MKKLLTAVLFAAAIATPLAASAASMPKVEKIATQPAKAKGVWIDVRSAEEFKEGHLQGALNIPHDQIVDRIKSVSPDKNAPVNLYCRSGRRAETAKQVLESMGYTNVQNRGGYEQLKQSGMR